MKLLEFLLLIEEVLIALRLERKINKRLRKFFLPIVIPPRQTVIPQVRKLQKSVNNILSELRNTISVRNKGVCAVYRKTNIDCMKIVASYLPAPLSNHCSILDLWKNPSESFVQLLRDYQEIIVKFKICEENGSDFLVANPKIKKFLYGTLDDFYYTKCFCCNINDIRYNECDNCSGYFHDFCPTSYNYFLIHYMNSIMKWDTSDLNIFPISYIQKICDLITYDDTYDDIYDE